MATARSTACPFDLMLSQVEGAGDGAYDGRRKTAGQSTADGERVSAIVAGGLTLPTFSASTSRARDAPTPGSQAAAG